MITLGIDEAGRGPLIGPMIIAGLSFKKDNLVYLKELNVRDSKKVSPYKRERLYPLILKLCEHYEIIKVTPKEIDESINTGLKITGLEANYIAKIIDNIQSDVVYIDSPINNPEKFAKIIEEKIKSKPRIFCEIKADEKYIEVSAASIVAKVIRDREIKELHKKYGYFGSGYPSDQRTIEFIKKHKEIINSEDFRKTWATLRKFI
jgi:ribonuclease H, mammalian HI/archaeal HII subfamily